METKEYQEYIQALRDLDIQLNKMLLSAKEVEFALMKMKGLPLTGLVNMIRDDISLRQLLKHAK